MDNSKILSFIRTGQVDSSSNYEVEGQVLRTFDRDKILYLLNNCKEEEFFMIMTSISDLLHHEATTIGLWATDKTPDEILEIARDTSFYKTDMDSFNNIFFQIKN